MSDAPEGHSSEDVLAGSVLFLFTVWTHMAFSDYLPCLRIILQIALGISGRLPVLDIHFLFFWHSSWLHLTHENCKILSLQDYKRISLTNAFNCLPEAKGLCKGEPRKEWFLPVFLRTYLHFPLKSHLFALLQFSVSVLIISNVHLGFQYLSRWTLYISG